MWRPTGANDSSGAAQPAATESHDQLCIHVRFLLDKVSRLAERMRRGPLGSSSTHYLRVGSPLTSLYLWATPHAPLPEDSSKRCADATTSCHSWHAWCPCCKRPLDIMLTDDRPGWTPIKTCDVNCDGALQIPRCWKPKACGPRFAYCACIWGSQAGFVLGAMVLGAALQRHCRARSEETACGFGASGGDEKDDRNLTNADLVLLHTDAVPKSALKLLSKVWTLHRVEFVEATSELFASRTGHTGIQPSRFDGCFTKLQVLGLHEYHKIVMLDVDLSVMADLNSLFELPAPAAMRRGPNNIPHGTALNGRSFFTGEMSLDQAEHLGWAWGQGSGINAGVMVLEPDKELYRRAMMEVKTPMHPEHIPGAGPEQDWLSRFFAPWWTHIGVSYNFQLHQVCYSMEAYMLSRAQQLAIARKWRTEINDHSVCLPARLALNPEDIHVVHFSGVFKLWDLPCFASHFHGTDCIDVLNRLCCANSFRLWKDRAGTEEEYRMHGLVQGKDGVLRFLHTDVSAEPVIKHGLEIMRKAAERSWKAWQENLCMLIHKHWPGLGIEQLCALCAQSTKPEDSLYATWDRVTVEWRDSKTYAGMVLGVHDDCTVDVVFPDFDEVAFRLDPAYVHLWENKKKPAY